ncbi:metalloregulator ArsR/SmtB family transcription factor [Arenimonas caeni]|jgi:DNA-binding transcriptional ArsR family regulator|uniref:ArsR/SmtB family transcription factor n=1 Tax=Arenimonas caeni TaxID=2058085 RepID=UPI002A36C55B|nr:metalloregulator ArsR/SmtB family transcription factor [Arenimonas caeni]MDY0023263.1 metalloregulator ArsR/SmtB family transcription factor [Arenimonas caeni]
MSARPRSSAAAPSELIESASEAAAELLKAMANPQRLRVLCLLVEREMSVGEINALVPLSQSALSQHLAMLRDKNLVSTRREAQTVYYSVADGTVHDVIEVLHRNLCSATKA